MKIVGFETFPVSVPYRHIERSFRVQRGGVSDVIVKLVTDTGLVGWGESCSGADTASVEAAVRAMAPFVVGRNPWDNEAIARDVYKTGLWDYRVQTGNFAYAGIDMALWDGPAGSGGSSSSPAPGALGAGDPRPSSVCTTSPRSPARAASSTSPTARG